MIFIDTFINDEVMPTFSYIAGDKGVPPGRPIGRQGNAVLLQDGSRFHVVYRPLIDGDIFDVIPDAASAPEIDLSEYQF